MTLLVTGPDGRWAPGIGDPTVGGWLATAGYFVASIACYLAARRAKRAQSHGRALYVAWIGLSVFMLLLGFNKQLDLQNLFTQVGRDIAVSGGWFEKRRRVQRIFVKALVLGGALSGGVLLWFLRRVFRQLWLAAVGVVLTLMFVVVRASSFYYVDWLLARKLGDVRVNWMLEAGGIACVLLAALVFRPRDS